MPMQQGKLKTALQLADKPVIDVDAHFEPGEEKAQEAERRQAFAGGTMAKVFADMGQPLSLPA